jgi:hypothetical protein
MSPRSSMQTRRLTSTLRRLICREPAARLVDTTAGSSCGVIPTAMAKENNNASRTGLCSRTLMARIEAVSTPATAAGGTASPVSFRNPGHNQSIRPTASRVGTSVLVGRCGMPAPISLRHSPGARQHPDAPCEKPEYGTVLVGLVMVRQTGRACCGLSVVSLPIGECLACERTSSTR